ncbi:hypothetical protein CY34DRAFT_83232 [Suillus luteus UH-Slu-Lm8-n1]|uniref:Uncharacterized protein n=1 Tax=Suillus luteus UH-Slu-Lm8-n1 TaxID=930992 RepID=A0A0D0AXU0_9AGAM|nr:hypothetical protein CY34DRAFT_83232 [Suillus luteus UH-Slu-Lm8-n1]
MLLYSQKTDLWIERSRLVGMLLGCVTYGIFFLLSVQSCLALMRRPQHGGKIANNRPALVFYVIITFTLRTLSISANAKYTEMIWIDLRNAPGGPLTLIEDEMAYPINIVALSTGHIQEWFMQALLLHRCFAIWNWAKCVTIPMITFYLVMIGLSVYIQVEASTGIAFYDINIEPAYLGIQVGLNVIYTILVAYRLLDMRRKMKELVDQYDSRLYDTLVLIIVESVMAYTIFAIVFIVAFAMHLNGITTICFLSIGQVQGIAQLIIIIRVATGRSYAHGYWSTRPAGVPTTVAFAEEEPTDDHIARL